MNVEFDLTLQEWARVVDLLRTGSEVGWGAHMDHCTGPFERGEPGARCGCDHACREAEVLADRIEAALT